jgi:hypothetical protein
MKQRISSCVGAFAASGLIACFGGLQCAAKLAVNRPYVTSMKGGAFYARAIPSGKWDAAGFTDIYRVGMEKDERVAHYEWYTREGLVLGWSPIAGDVAVMARLRVPTNAPDKQVELSFYFGGKLLRSWTTVDLQKLGVPVGLAGEDGPATPCAEFRLGGCEQIPGSNEYVFRIQFAGDKTASFDILTGELYRPHKLTAEQAKTLAGEVARGKGIALDDYVLGTEQFDARKGAWELFYYHKPLAYPGGHFAVYVTDETKATRFIGGR